MSFDSNQKKLFNNPEKSNCFTEEHLKQQELLNNLKLTFIQKKMVEFLLKHRGYSPQDIETNREFLISLGNNDFKTLADLIITIGGKRFIFVKCAPNSPDSWERYSIAFCRVIDSHQIPYAFITDGDTAALLNTIDGTAKHGDIRIMPSKDEAESLSRITASQSYPENRKEREKRIVYAFEALKDSVKTHT